jgi:hypothetical protein
LVLASLAAPSFSAFTAEATTRPGLSNVKKALLVTLACHEVFNCADVERRVFSDLVRLKVPFTLVSPELVRGRLLDLGVEAYSADLRAKLAEEFGGDAFIELELVHGQARSLGRRGSDVTVKMRIVLVTGEIVMLGEGTGRAINTVSSPESIAQETYERIIKRAFTKAK